MNLGSTCFTKCLLTTVFFIQVILLTVTDSEKLDEYIHDYQTLTFDTKVLHSKHERVRRSTDQTLHLNFHVYNRHFSLRLKRDTEIFSSEHELLEPDGQRFPVDTSFIYSGHVKGIPNSHAHIAVINGSAQGHIYIPGDTTYHIEAAAQYFENPNFHAVIYPENRMDKDPFRRRRSLDEVGSCGIDRVKEWMDKVSKSAVEEKIDIQRLKRSTSYHHYGTAETYQNKYSAQANKPQQHRKKRAIQTANNTCFLYLRSDPEMWNYVKHKKFKQTLSDERAKEEILAFFANHVNALKRIFLKTTFTTYTQDLRYGGINFVVQRTSIMTPANQNCGTTKATSYCNPNIDVSNFLNLNSMDQHDEFCLAYIFTHRDFTRGTLGLAWVGAREVASGGICERHKSYMERDETVPKSLNTGIVTTVNYGKAVPSRVSQLTFTHEVGHNFGSPCYDSIWHMGRNLPSVLPSGVEKELTPAPSLEHDQGDECAPFGTNQPLAEDGNYIMFASATMGDRPNNDHFSICSKDNITRLLHVIFNELSGKRNCFKPSKTAFCGNAIKEEGEQCDCGYYQDCNDECCFGKDSPQGTPCTLRKGAQCSPTAGPCCDSKCRFVKPEAMIKCMPADDCKQAVFCNNSFAECPAPRLEPDGTSCNDDAQMCFKGECNKTVCERINWKECFLTSDLGDDGPSREALCYVSCTNPETRRCVSSFDKTAINKPENKAFRDLLLNVTRKRSGNPSVMEPDGIQLPAGSPCDNFRGYCDVFHKCRGVDADGPLARLKNLIFNPETLENIQQWIVKHWWAVLLMGIALIIVMGAFIKICAVHTPSSNPRKPKARQLTLPRTLQRRRQQHRQQQQQQQGQSSSGQNQGHGGGGSGGGGGNRRPMARSVEERKPATSETVQIVQEPPPPYSSSALPLTPIERIAPPSSSSSPLLIEPVRAPDLTTIPSGGPKRGHGGARKKEPEKGAKGKKKGKATVEMQRL